jgi:hypothetical protein
MGVLTYPTFRVLVEQEFARVTMPSGPSHRRLGVNEYVEKVMAYIRRDLNEVERLLNEGQFDLQKAIASVVNLTLELTSLLYAANADHKAWRRWSSLTAFGMFLAGQIHDAAQYAVLGGEWAFLHALPAAPVVSKQLSARVLWQLVGGKPKPTLPLEENDEYDNAWLTLAHSIPAHNHHETEEALKIIADFWMEETGGDWKNFHLRSYPDFETPACVAAALARHSGFEPTSLTFDQYSFLEAGLAAPEPPPLFPTYFSLPTSQAEAGK